SPTIATDARSASAASDARVPNRLIRMSFRSDHAERVRWFRRRPRGRPVGSPRRPETKGTARSGGDGSPERRWSAGDPRPEREQDGDGRAPKWKPRRRAADG